METWSMEHGIWSKALRLERRNEQGLLFKEYNFEVFCTKILNS
jgi:hypothetical protein